MTPLLLAVCDPAVMCPAPSAVNWPTAAPTRYPKIPFMVASEHADAGTAMATAKSRTAKLILRKFIDLLQHADSWAIVQPPSARGGRDKGVTGRRLSSSILSLRPPSRQAETVRSFLGRKPQGARKGRSRERDNCLEILITLKIPVTKRYRPSDRT